MKNKLDVLLVARPDHSMQIYRALLNQDKLSYKYITFKVVPEFIKKIFPYKKLQTVSRCCKIAIRPTIIQVCKKTFYFKFAQNWRTDDFLSTFVRNELKKRDYKLIHYWPEYSSSVMNSIILDNKDNTIILADMYMPNPAVIIDDMESVYRKFRLPSAKNSWLAVYAEQTKEQFKYVTDIIVASSYVQKSMEQTFPNKRYHVIPYGIPISPIYKKKEIPDRIRKYAFVGRVSVEKGCDIILEWFSKHPEREIHLYGGLWESQRSIFEPFWKYSNIHYHGTVSKETLRRETPQCDVGILLSRFDAYAMAVGEMIGCGIPVIVSDKTGIMDDVKSNGFGLVSEVSIESFEKTVLQMDNAELYCQFCDNIDNYIKSEPKSFGENMVDLYRSLINT